MSKKKPNPNYDHIEQGDNRVPLPEEYKYLEEYGFRCYRYGRHVFLVGPGFNMNIIDEFLRKIKNQESLVIAITGPPGSGKTYLGITLAQILDPLFQCTDIPPPPPTEDTGQITFERDHILYLSGENSPLKRGQVILPDETHFGIGARGWANKKQQEVTNYVAAIRSKGFVLILIVLHTQMIDKMLRDFVVNYEIHVTKRGEGVVYRRWFPPFGNEMYKTRLGKICLPLPDDDQCSYPSCLGCKEQKNCPTIRAVYERRKEHFLNHVSKKEKEENEETNPYLEIIDRTKIRENVNADTRDKDLRTHLENDHGIQGLSNREITRLRRLIDQERKKT